MCLLLFLGTKEEGCSSCSMIDDQLVTQYGTVKVINFLDFVEKELKYVKIEGKQVFTTKEFEDSPYSLSPDTFNYTWDIGYYTKVFEKKVKAGVYVYHVHKFDFNDKEEIADFGRVTITVGKTLTIRIK
jgi:hypothetical protein